MKKIAAMSIIPIVAGCATTADNLPTQANVDLKQYVGTWHEQARLPNRFQRDCVGDVQADYALQPNGAITVINQCRTKDGSVKKAVGEARLSRDANNADASKLQVRFAPQWLSWLPLVWGDYWIIKLEGDYQYSLVGTPDRKYLWVLSRAKQANSETVSKLLDYAGTLGFAVDQIVK